MALTGLTVTALGNQGQGSTVKVEGKTRVQFDLDADYATGGYTAFTTFLQTVLGTKRSIIAVYQASAAGGYTLIWNRATDALMVYQGAAGLGPNTEVPVHTSLAVAGANVEMIVEWC
jgi:hypothetical protein